MTIKGMTLRGIKLISGIGCITVGGFGLYYGTRERISLTNILSTVVWGVAPITAGFTLVKQGLSKNEVSK